MHFELPPLPYAKDALEPHLSARTLEFHYEKHHRGYLQKLEGAIAGTPLAERSLEEIITGSDGAVFRNAAQVWNHTFYWDGMKPAGGGAPRGRTALLIDRDFGSFDAFQSKFVDCATGLFGSGYVWLHLDPATERLALAGMKDADSPLLTESVPLLCMDVWEHAYYLDYQNGRDRYARAFLSDLVNWSFVEENLEKAQ